MTPGARSALALAATLATTGSLHLARPGVFARIVPPHLGSPHLWSLVSGAAEIGCAAGLAVPPARRAAALATAGLFVAVFPANVRMTQLALRDPRSSAAYRAVTVLRLPLQVPLVRWALAVAGAGAGR